MAWYRNKLGHLGNRKRKRLEQSDGTVVEDKI